MKRLAGSAALCVLCCLFATSATVSAQTPMRWLAHDLRRPRPPVVTPARLGLPVPPPSDAVILFDGTDLSKWRDAEGGPAKWKAQEGYMESVPNSGYLFSAEKFGDAQLHPCPPRGAARDAATAACS